jgi:hypothetical protein
MAAHLQSIEVGSADSADVRAICTAICTALNPYNIYSISSLVQIEQIYYRNPPSNKKEGGAAAQGRQSAPRKIEGDLHCPIFSAFLYSKSKT